jgi:subtilisin
MRRHLSLAIVVTALFVALLALAQPAFGSPLRKIVVFKPGFYSDRAAASLTRHGATVGKKLALVGGAAIFVPDQATADAIAADPAVAFVEDDARVRALARPNRGGGGGTPPQQTPWGITRIGAPSVWATTNSGDPIKVGIVDTGIQTNHPDLQANIKGGVTFVSGTTTYNDDNGHGTHVAGIVAALNNTQGVVGVAPLADLYGIKVLDRNGSGYVSSIIQGLDWAVANKMQVINMSLGSSSYSASFDLACQRVAAAGIVDVVAAGNSGPGANTVDYPGKFSSCIAVGATDSNNNIASFSSRGPEVAVSAPGVSVYSTYKGSAYATLSGTSMASPHVTGTVALMLTHAPSAVWDTDHDGVWDPAEVKAKLQSTALDLGTTGFDTSFGWGLVRANLAAL